MRTTTTTATVDRRTKDPTSGPFFLIETFQNLRQGRRDRMGWVGMGDSDYESQLRHQS